MKVKELKLNPKNPRRISPDHLAKLTASIQTFPKMMELRPIVYDPETMHVLGGNQRLQAIKNLKMTEIPDSWVKSAADLTPEEKKAFILKDNVPLGEWDFEALEADFAEFDLEEMGIEIPFSEEAQIITQKEAKITLQDKFIVPPFSVLDTKMGYWQERKKTWINGLGIKTEARSDLYSSGSLAASVPGYYKKKAQAEGKIGRTLTNDEFQTDFLPDMMPKNSIIKQTDGGGILSIFDPVLCEICYKWFNIPNGKILDPFAGGSVRGIVASMLGMDYLGIDLSSKQIEENVNQANDILVDGEKKPEYVCGDSTNIDVIAGEYEADMIFSCPPYADLEKYSDDPLDLSNMNYDDFKEAYMGIIKKTCQKLKSDRFAVLVVGEVRDKKGTYYNFVSDTISAFIDAGLSYYNEIILATSIGSLPIRITKQFQSGRKIGKSHQNVLVFYNGNPKNIKQNFPELELGNIECLPW